MLRQMQPGAFHMQAKGLLSSDRTEILDREIDNHRFSIVYSVIFRK